MIPSDGIKERARAKARTVLRAAAPSSRPCRCGPAERSTSRWSRRTSTNERNRHGLARPLATDSGKDMGYKGYDPAFGGDTRAFNELVDSVDFPKFVADLLKAVFDANLKVMKTQTDSYIKLMKEATKSTADFIKKVKDDESLREARRVEAATSTTSSPKAARTAPPSSP